MDQHDSFFLESDSRAQVTEVRYNTYETHSSSSGLDSDLSYCTCLFPTFTLYQFHVVGKPCSLKNGYHSLCRITCSCSLCKQALFITTKTANLDQPNLSCCVCHLSQSTWTRTREREQTRTRPSSKENHCSKVYWTGNVLFERFHHSTCKLSQLSINSIKHLRRQERNEDVRFWWQNLCFFGVNGCGQENFIALGEHKDTQGITAHYVFASGRKWGRVSVLVVWYYRLLIANKWHRFKAEVSGEVCDKTISVRSTCGQDRVGLEWIGEFFSYNVLRINNCATLFLSISRFNWNARIVYPFQYLRRITGSSTPRWTSTDQEKE